MTLFGLCQVYDFKLFLFFLFWFKSSLARALQPSILMQMKLTDGRSHRFEVHIMKYIHYVYLSGYSLLSSIYTDEPKRYEPLTDEVNNIDCLVTTAHVKVWDILDGKLVLVVDILECEDLSHSPFTWGIWSVVLWAMFCWEYPGSGHSCGQFDTCHLLSGGPCISHLGLQWGPTQAHPN